MLHTINKRGRILAILRIALKRFFHVDGPHWAGAFAFNALFSLFPLILLFVTIASIFIDRHQAEAAIIDYIEGYFPLSGKMQNNVIEAISEVIKGRGQAGIFAMLFLVFAAHQCFITLIFATNRAWGSEVRYGWKLPLKSLALLGITAATVLLGMVVPVLMSIGERLFLPASITHSRIYALGGGLVPLVVAFLSLSLFYKLAPQKTKRFSDVYLGALCSTVLLFVTKIPFVFYLGHVATPNAIYGAFGGIIALLMWIYLSGCIFIYGACICAAQNAPPVMDKSINQSVSGDSVNGRDTSSAGNGKGTLVQKQQIDADSMTVHVILDECAVPMSNVSVTASHRRSKT